MDRKKIIDCYREIEAKMVNDDIVVVNLWKDFQKSNDSYVRIIFAYNKLIYTGDMGQYIFGKTISDIFTFFKVEDYDPYYWMEKVEASDKPCIKTEIDINKLKSLLNDLIKTWKVSEEDKSDLFEDSDSLDFDSNVIRATDTLNTFLEKWKKYCEPCEDSKYLINQAEEFDSRFIYACEVIRWVSNSLETWLSVKSPKRQL